MVQIAKNSLGGDVDLGLGESPGEGPHEDLMLVGECRKDNILNRGIQLPQEAQALGGRGDGGVNPQPARFELDHGHAAVGGDVGESQRLGLFKHPNRVALNLQKRIMKT